MKAGTGAVKSRKSAKSKIIPKQKETIIDKLPKKASRKDVANKHSTGLPSALTLKPKQDSPSVKKPAEKIPLKTAKSVKTTMIVPAYYADAPPLSDEAALRRAIKALLEQDKAVISAMLDIAGMPPLRRREPGFSGLIAIITGQQVSVASARAINERILAAFPDVSAQAFSAASDDALRACGLSAPKMRAIRALSEAVITGIIDLERLHEFTAGEAHRKLCALHGIGPWTADIFLLFCLGFSDAWPAGDLALQEAARIILGLERRPDARQMAQIGERWRPYRGAAAHLLWACYGAVKAGRQGIPEASM